MYEGWGEHLEGWIRGCGWPHNARTPEHDLAFAAAMRAMGRQTALAVLPELGALFAINMRDFGDTWNESEIRGWMEGAGLNGIHRQDVGPDRWLFTGFAGGC